MTPPGRVTIRLAAAAIAMATIAALVGMGRVGNWLAIAYSVMTVAAIAAYAFDKRAAEQNEWRVSEATLHGIDLFFGIIGGLVAQALLRHKTSKRPFAIVTGAIYVLHMAGLGFLLLGGRIPL